MNWDVGANCYLLKAVHTYGKDWDLVSTALQMISKTFLKDEVLNNLSKQSCSLQYNYIIASIRQRSSTELSEDELLSLALDQYTTLRRDQLHTARLELLRAIKIEEEDAEKLREGRFAEIPPCRLTIYRKRCQAFGIPDRIGNSLHLEPLSPGTEEEYKAIRENLTSPKRLSSGIGEEISDKDGGSWFPVKAPRLCDLFTDNPSENYRASVSRFIRAQALLSKRIGTELPDDEVSSVDTTSTVQVQSEEISDTLGFQDSKIDFADPDGTNQQQQEQQPNRSSKISDTLEIQAGIPSPTSSIQVSDTDTLASPIITQSLNSGSPISGGLGDARSPGLKSSGQRNRNRHRMRQKMPSGTGSSIQDSEFSSGMSPLVQSAGMLEDGCLSSQSAIIRRWRRGLISALSTVCSHRHAYVFMNPVTEDIAPGYGTVVYEPIDLTSLRRRMEATLNTNLSSPSSEAVVIDTATKFIRDLLLMFANACMYNNRNHEVYRMAREMFHDVVTELQPLWSVLTEDFPGFPPLPVFPSHSAGSAARSSTVRPIIVPTTLAHSPILSTAASSQTRTTDVCKPPPTPTRQAKRSQPEVVSMSSPRKRHQSSGSETSVGVTTRSR